MFELEPINLEKVSDKSFNLEANYPISKKSIFGDDLWDYSDKSNERLNSVNDSKLKIDWKKWRNKLPDGIIEDVKVLAFFCLNCPSVIAKTHKTVSKGYKPNTISAQIYNLFRFIYKIYSSNIIELTPGEHVNSIHTFSDISLQDIKGNLVTNDCINWFNRGAKFLLTALANPIVQNYIYGAIDWNAQDIKNTKIYKQIINTKEVSYQDKPLPDEFFQFITKKATIDVVSFLKQMNLQIDSLIPMSYEGKLTTFFDKCNLTPLYEDYITIREMERDFATKEDKRTCYTSNEKVKFFKKHGVKISEFHDFINRIHRASLFLLLQFTGVRYSEATMFKFGCEKKISTDVYVLKGAVIKHRDSSLPNEVDEWVACPIVRDSYRVLEQFSRFTFNKYLLSNTYSVYLDVLERPFSNSGINQALSLYAADIDVENRFSEVKPDKNGTYKRVIKKKYHISVHRLRHTLALNLVRAKLGIPYISYHLKHVHTALVAYKQISDVTLGYGGIENEIFNISGAVQQAKEELIKDLYHPDAPIEGGVNKEEFKKRRREFFQGRMVNDEDIEDIMEELKQNGAPLADVGLGYCGGKKEIVLKDGSRKSPPCIGQLKCNPVQCGNAIIPKSKLPIWIKMYKSNKEKLTDPFFDYAKEEIQKFLNESKEVLQYFEVKVDELL